MNYTKPYCTADLDLATFLQISGFAPTVTPASRRNRCEFHFTDSTELQQAISAYVSGSARVSPPIFSAVRRELAREIERVLEAAGNE